MTCIAAVTDGKSVWMGGDSLITSGYEVLTGTQPKVFRNGKFLCGTCGDLRFLQLVRYAFTPPAMTEDEDLETYLATRFLASLRSCFKDAGFSETENGRENANGDMLIAYQGRLFRLSGWYSYAEPAWPYAATGSGGEVATGVLFATADTDKAPADRIRFALEAAERHSVGVRGPFTILSTKATV